MVKKTQPVETIVTRIKSDKHMGAFYDWLASIPPNQRSREILAFARFGFGLQTVFSHNSVAGMLSFDLKPVNKIMGEESKAEDANTAPIDPTQRMKELGYDMDFLTPPP